MSLASETDDGGSRRKRILSSPSLYFHPQSTIGSSSGLIGVVPFTQPFGIEPLHVVSVDLSLLHNWFTVSVGQTGETDVEEVSASWLPEALEELDAAQEDAQEEGYESVTDLAVNNARKLLNDLARRVVHSPIVHSMPDGGIAIDFRNPEKGAAILMVCEPDGEGVYFHQFGGKRGRGRVTDAADLLETGGWLVIGKAGLT